MKYLKFSLPKKDRISRGASSARWRGSALFVYFFTCLTLNLLLSHFNLRHSGDTRTIKCRFDSCDRDYEKINSLVKHVQDKHRQHLCDADESEGRIKGDRQSNCFVS